eukprot:1642172-Rhodomonas_salina.2
MVPPPRIILRGPYAISGSNIGHTLCIALRAPYAMSGTDIRHTLCIVLRDPYAMSGTDVGHETDRVGGVGCGQ